MTIIEDIFSKAKTALETAGYIYYNVSETAIEKGYVIYSEGNGIEEETGNLLYSYRVSIELYNVIPVGKGIDQAGFMSNFFANELPGIYEGLVSTIYQVDGAQLIESQYSTQPVGKKEKASCWFLISTITFDIKILCN